MIVKSKKHLEFDTSIIDPKKPQFNQESGIKNNENIEINFNFHENRNQSQNPDIENSIRDLQCDSATLHEILLY
jgi:hypothetical protein